MTTPSLEVVLVTDAFVVATWRRFVALVFDGNLDVDNMERLRLASKDWLQRYPGKTVDLAVVHPGATQMTNDERRKLASVVKENENNRIAAATVILAKGLRGALHRSVVTAVNMLAPPPYPGKVFGNSSEALAWLAPYITELCGEAPIDQLGVEVERLRNRLPEPPAEGR